MDKRVKQLKQTMFTLQAPVACEKAGSVLRSAGNSRVLALRTDPTNSVLAVLSVRDQTVELFQFLSEEEANVKFKKRLQKQRKKASK